MIYAELSEVCKGNEDEEALERRNLHSAYTCKLLMMDFCSEKRIRIVYVERKTIQNIS